MLGFFFSRLTRSQLLALNCSFDDVGLLLVLLISFFLHTSNALFCETDPYSGKALSTRFIVIVILINMKLMKTYCQKILFCDKFARNLGA